MFAGILVIFVVFFLGGLLILPVAAIAVHIAKKRQQKRQYADAVAVLNAKKISLEDFLQQEREREERRKLDAAFDTVRQYNSRK